MVFVCRLSAFPAAILFPLSIAKPRGSTLCIDIFEVDDRKIPLVSQNFAEIACALFPRRQGPSSLTETDRKRFLSLAFTSENSPAVSLHFRRSDQQPVEATK
jgi:hypothetical protein